MTDADHPLLWFMLAIARYINWPDTLEELIASGLSWPDDPRFTPEELAAILEARAARGAKVFGAAYKITAGGTSTEKSKVRYIAEDVIGAMWRSGNSFGAGIKFTAPFRRIGCGSKCFRAAACSWPTRSSPICATPIVYRTRLTS